MENTNSLSVRDIVEFVDEFAPFSTAEEWDNVGLLVGHPDRPVDAVLCALDLTEKTVEEAVRFGCNLIVTHHPVMFRGRKNLKETDLEGRALCRLVREGIALVAAHTNFDNAHPGVNDRLAETLGLKNVLSLPSCMCIGDADGVVLQDLRKHAEKALGDCIRIYGDEDKPIQKLAVVGGSGGDFVEEAKENGADAFLTGEISYHSAQEWAANGICILEAGHQATETPAVSLLANALQERIHAVKYDVRVHISGEI